VTLHDATRAIFALKEGESLTLGSDGAADLVLTGPGVAPVHARILRRQGALGVQDLDTEAGTFVNGAEVRGLVPVRTGDTLRLGGVEWRIARDAGAADVAATAADTPRSPRAVHGMAVTLDGVTVTVKTASLLRQRPKDILKDVSIHIAPGEFVGILGASGSGKSTLIKTIAGLAAPSAGRILLDGRSVGPYELQKDRRIAYLPQDVIIHEQISARHALGYIAELKGHARSRDALEQAVVDATAKTGIAERLDVPIRRLSGGQRKRAALAAELIGDPRLLLLDEATSGLDPATEGEMMRLFRSLADEGRTVVCITHFPNRLALCDRLIYLMDGHVVFCGTPTELRELFGTQSIEEVYLAQGGRSADEWRQAFDASPAGAAARQAFSAAMVSGGPRAGGKASIEGPAAAPSAQPDAITQGLTLVRRYFALQRADWPNLILLFLQAPAIALMIALSYGSVRANFYELQAADTKEVIFLIVIAVLWCSGMAAVREIVKEQSIVRHEVRFGLRLMPYLLSKVALLSLLALAQAAVLLWLVRHFTELTGGFAVQFTVLAVTSAVGLALGLLVSAAVGSSERAMTVLPVVLIMQAIFSGGISRPEGAVKLISQITVPAYWSLDGIRSTFSTGLTFATYPNAPGHFQPPILGTGGPLWLDLAALLLHGTAFCALAYWVLHRRFR
jgi:ABC-type multidrug transport system ATPase subunit